VAPQTQEQMAYLDAEGLTALVRQLAHPGAQARWVSRFSPAIDNGADPKTCTPRPFAHLMIGQRQALRTAYGALLKERVTRNAPAVPIPPPRVSDLGNAASPLLAIDGGCMICGVGHQLVSAALVAQQGRERVAHDVWTPQRATTEQLGGRPSPQQLSGHLCRVCDAACSSAGSMGPSALERALVAHLEPGLLGMLLYGQLRIPGLVGWAAEVERGAPNQQPFAHLGDISELTDQLRSALGG
jgi:hypothetical protein